MDSELAWIQSRMNLLEQKCAKLEEQNQVLADDMEYLEKSYNSLLSCFEQENIIINQLVENIGLDTKKIDHLLDEINSKVIG